MRRKEPKNYSEKRTTAVYKKRRQTMSKKEQHGQKSQDKTSQADLTKKAEEVTNAKILDLTLKHLARKLETPAGHHSALE